MKQFLIFSSILLFYFSAYAEKVSKLKDIPQGVVKYCFDSSGRIADVGQQWEASDDGNSTLPRSILIGACKHSTTEWSVLCKQGGYATQYLLVKVKKTKSVWKKVEANQSPNEPEMKCQ